MKVAFVSENRFTGKVPRNSDNLRTDLAWMVALDATHYPFYFDKVEKHDVVIVILPKKNIRNLFSKDLMGFLKTCGDSVLFMQEGPNDFWQDYELDEQIYYSNILTEFDGILCHNEMDKTYYEAYTNKPVFPMPSLMIEDNLKLLEVNRTGVMIGGTMCQWYGGMDSLTTALNISDEIYAPSMGRKKEAEDYFEVVNYLPYMNWHTWIGELNKRKYGVHLMRTFAAGTFALNCAYLGIPCIGYNLVDTQKTLFPDLAVSYGNLMQATKLAKKLKTDIDFYNYTSNKAKQLYQEFYTEDKFRLKMTEIFNKIKQSY